MISRQNFEAYMAMSRRLGNARLPYTILVNTNDFITDSIAKEASIASGVRPKVIWLDSSKHVDDLRLPEEYCYSRFDPPTILSLDKAVDYIIGSTDLMTIVVGEIIDFEHTPYFMLFNEVHTNRELQTKTFRLAKQYDVTWRAYVKQLIDDPQYIAIPAPNFDLGVLGFAKWEPWLTLLLHKPTNEALQIVWDTREIIGHAELSDNVVTELLKTGNANDNCNLLFNMLDIELPTFDKFIIDNVQTNN